LAAKTEEKGKPKKITMDSSDSALCAPELPADPTTTPTPEEAFLACSSRWYNTLRKYSFATEGVGLFSVALVGILANLLSIAVLCQRTMKSQITALLITLAVFDILFLVSTFNNISLCSKKLDH
jgi:hypothetical protein